MAVGIRALDRDRLWFRVGAVAVVGLAVVLRLRGLSNWSFWLDEAMQVDYVRRGFGPMWSALVLDGVHPPLDYVACWLWYRISPDEGWLRLLPVLWSAGTVVALLVRCGGGSAPSRSLAAAGAFATFPLAVVLGQEVRPYAAALLNALAVFAERMRVGYIAEGIETPDELQAVIDADVPWGQGFIFGEPRPLGLASNV